MLKNSVAYIKHVHDIGTVTTDNWVVVGEFRELSMETSKLKLKQFLQLKENTTVIN